jgi:recombination protein RecT
VTTNTVSQAVAQREAGPVAIINQNKGKLGPVLPDHIDVDQFVGLAVGALFRDSKLMEAANNSPAALMNALMRCAALGHQPGTDEFYLTPRKIKGTLQIQGIEGYRGIVERMYRSGAVASVVVREVCANDPFRYIEGQDEVPVHEIGGRGTTGADYFGADGNRDRGQMVGVYAYAKLTTGAVSRVVILSKSDVMAAKESSDGANSEHSPWNRLDGGKERPQFKGRSMWWKTAARRLEPWVPTSAEYRREQLRAAVEADNLRREPAVIRDIETGHAYDAGTGEIVDGEFADDQP